MASPNPPMHYKTTLISFHFSSSLSLITNQARSPPLCFFFLLIFSFHQPNIASSASKMAAKRLRGDPDNDSDKPEGKRLRPLPSFTMVIRQAMVANHMQNLWLQLEPVVRRVVKEEVERGLVRRACWLPRSPQMLIEEAKPSSGLQLIFKKPPSLSMFTENRIETEDGFPLEILLVDTETLNKPTAASPPAIKVELVVLDGDFPCDDSESWFSADFSSHIVRERKGKRPLLTGDTVVTLQDGSAAINELKITDNSSWMKNRHFRIGARVLSDNQLGLNIREAVTTRFMVKDHRGETYKKHFPPSLSDEVWRLEKIGKDGVFHKRLMAENINTVQDFLKLSVIDCAHLRKILGMSEKFWEATNGHARTCTLGDKLYIHHGPRWVIALNSICEVVSAEVDGVSSTLLELSMAANAPVRELVLEAYSYWDSLKVINFPLQGEPENKVVFEPHPIEGYLEVGFIQNGEQMDLWSDDAE